MPYPISMPTDKYFWWAQNACMDVSCNPEIPDRRRSSGQNRGTSTWRSPVRILSHSVSFTTLHNHAGIDHIAGNYFHISLKKESNDKKDKKIYLVFQEDGRLLIALSLPGASSAKH